MEEGLGHWLADRFIGQLPADEELARGVSKRASDRLPTKKDKDKWKDKARLARQAAEKGGARAEAVADAGAQAKASAEQRFMRTTVDPNFAKAGLAAAAAAAPTPTVPAPSLRPLPRPRLWSHLCAPSGSDRLRSPARQRWLTRS